MDFKDWFCLKNRESFTIDPKVNPSDAQFYFGRKTLEERMLKQMGRAFIDPRVPKMMIWGAYGCGKTQTLYYLEHCLTHKKPSQCKGDPHLVHLEIEVQNSKSPAASWHLQLTEALGMATVQGWLNTLFDKSPDPAKAIAALTSDPNVVNAFTNLRGGGDLAFTAWRWLTGQKLPAKEQENIKVTRNLGDVGTGDLVAALLALGNLAAAVHRRLIFCMDEMEELQNVREGDASESWHQYLRKLSDTANSTVGFILSCKGDTRDDMPRILNRQDVRSRIGELNYIELETLAAPANVKAFVEELLGKLVNQEAANQRIQAEGLTTTVQTYPFTATAFDLLCDYACQDAVKSTPRNIIKAINECAIAAHDAQEKVVGDSIVNDIAPIIFG
jgi:hypothetical protein